MKLSSLVKRISGEGAAAWDIHARARRDEDNGKDVIVLSVGDPDFATPEPIIESAVTALRAGDTHYAATAGRDALRRAIAADFQQQSGVPTTAENVFVFAGTQNALFAASLVILEHGDEVIALEPMYVSYEASLALGGAKLVTVAQRADALFRPDPAAIEAAITPATRAIIITTPNNPTGVVLTNTELQAIARIAIEHDLWVISDEVYTDIIFEGSHHSIAALPGMAERTITLNSLSKSHAMTGWRVGWTIGPKILSEHFDNLTLCMLYGIPGFVQQAALTALTDQRDASKAMRDIYKRRRDLVCDELEAASGLGVLKPVAGMYVLIDVRRYYDDANDFVHELYDSTGVSVLNAGAFGTSGKGWVRLSFTLSEAKLAEACQRIVRFINNKVDV